MHYCNCQLKLNAEKIKKEHLLHFYIKRNDDRENFTHGRAAIIYLKQVDVFDVIRFPSEITGITVQIYFIKVCGIDTSSLE